MAAYYNEKSEEKLGFEDIKAEVDKVLDRVVRRVKNAVRAEAATAYAAKLLEGERINYSWSTEEIETLVVRVTAAVLKRQKALRADNDR